MIGLLMLLALGLYLAISAGVVTWTVRWAKHNGRGVWRWGIAAGFAMYLLVFWDHIPTLILYKHYCATKAGFWVYKTPEQWKAENPGVAETLTWKRIPQQFTRPGIDRGYKLNERFVWVHQVIAAPILPVRLSNEAVVDTKTNETVVKRVSVRAGYSGGKEYFSFWLSLGPYTPGDREFAQYLDGFHQYGREVK